jgi:hypothetical protein
VDRVEGLLSKEFCSRGELDNSSKPIRTRAKGSPPEKYFTENKKELLILSWGDVEEGSFDEDDDDDL